MINKEDYIRLNNSFKHCVTFSWERLGFYSNFNNMILTMAICLKYRLRFRVYCKDYELLNKTGWGDMFLPLECETKNSFFAHFNFRRKLVTNSSLNDRLHLLVNNLYPILTGNNLANAVFAESRTCWFLKDTFDIPELGFKGGLRVLCGELAGVAYRFNGSYRKYIDDYKKKVKLPPPQQYVSLHIRRGDKDTEREETPIAAYMEAAAKATELREAFILTDDYTVIETLQRDYPDWTFHTLTRPDERGFVYKQAISDNTDNWIKLFAAMEYITASCLFIGTCSSNPGMFAGMVMKNVIYMDSPDWILM